MLDTKKSGLTRSIVAVLVVCVGVAGCATRPQGTGQANAQSQAEDDCNPLLLGIGGALLGGLLSKGNNRVKGAALGAGLASLACVAWNYNARQTKTAAQVERDYKTANQGQLPTRSTVTRYDTSIDSGGRVSPGNKLVLNSNIEVVKGTTDKELVVEEELRMNRPDGSELRKVRKKANEIQGAGGYSTTYSIGMPEGVPQGEYPIQTALYVNGERAAGRNLKMQVVVGPQGAVVAMAE